jgi:hypothetical protein
LIRRSGAPRGAWPFELAFEDHLLLQPVIAVQPNDGHHAILS